MILPALVVDFILSVISEYAYVIVFSLLAGMIINFIFEHADIIVHALRGALQKIFVTWKDLKYYVENVVRNILERLGIYDVGNIKATIDKLVKEINDLKLYVQTQYNLLRSYVDNKVNKVQNDLLKQIEHGRSTVIQYVDKRIAEVNIEIEKTKKELNTRINQSVNAVRNELNTKVAHINENLTKLQDKVIQDQKLLPEIAKKNVYEELAAWLGLMINSYLTYQLLTNKEFAESLRKMLGEWLKKADKISEKLMEPILERIREAIARGEDIEKVLRELEERNPAYIITSIIEPIKDDLKKLLEEIGGGLGG